jgi:2-alkyl-3-oxoalkanoate reductase
MKKFRVGIVGAGYVAPYHLRGLRSTPEAEVVAVADPDQAKAQTLARQFSIPAVYASLGEMLAAGRPDAVHILTAPSLHAVLSIQALEAGCHVFVEKPMAETVEDCDRMMAAATQAGRVLSVNHSARMDPIVLQARQLVERGAIGDVLAVNFLRNSSYIPYAGGPAIPLPFRNASYPFQDLGVHGLYLVESFLGPAVRVEAEYWGTGRDPYLFFDEWRAHVMCRNGVGQMSISWNTQPMLNEMFIQGTRGTIHLDMFLQMTSVRRTYPGVPKPGQRILGVGLGSLKSLKDVTLNTVRFATGRLAPNPGIGVAVRTFYEALAKETPVPIPADEGRRMVALLASVSASADRVKEDHEAARTSHVMQPSRVLVTGAGGFLGRALVRRLIDAGERVRVLVRRPVAEWAVLPNIDTVIGDLGDAEMVNKAVAGVETVFHVGAAMKGFMEEFQRGTVWGTRNVLEACKKHGTRRLIHVSSLSVLDHAGHRYPAPVTEDSAYEPFPERRGLYTQTKLEAERLVRKAMEEDGLEAVILRPGQIFGPGVEKTPPSGALQLAGAWTIIGSGRWPVPLVHVEDVVDALLAAERPEAKGAIVQLVDPERITQNEVTAMAVRSIGVRARHIPKWLFYTLAMGVEMMGKVLKRDMPLTRYRVTSLRPLTGFDQGAAQSKLGWRPRLGARAGLRALYPDPR